MHQPEKHPILKQAWRWLSSIGLRPGLDRQTVREVQTLNRVGFIAGILVLPFVLPQVNPTAESFSWTELICFGGFMSVLAWHALGCHRMAIIAILLTANFKVFFAASYRGQGAGEQLFFIPLIMGLLLLYGGNPRRRERWAMWGVTLVSFALLEITGYQLMAPDKAFPSKVIEQIFSVNFTISATIILAITHYYFKLARLQQGKLESSSQQQQALNTQLADHVDALSQRNDQLKRKEAALILAKDQAEMADRAKSDFLSVISHELRTPLNAVIGSADLLKTTGLDSEQTGYLENMRQGGENLYVILDNILKLSHGEDGNLSLHLSIGKVDELLTQAIHPFMRQATEKQIALHWHRDSQAPVQIMGDQERLLQVLRNLISNGIKFTTVGEVSLRVYTQEQAGKKWWCFSVTDTGVGMDGATQARMFEPFVQRDSSRTRSHDGVGIGLTVSKQLVELMGGHLQVQSEPGVGTHILVQVPYVEAPQSEPKAVTKPPTNTRNQALRILVVEDNLVNQKVARSLLRKLGYEAEIAENGAIALETLQKRPFDLVFMDMQMPVMNGLEATTEIRRAATINPQPIIIAMTANASAQDQAACEAVGMDDFIAKPVRKPILQQMLDKWANRERTAAC